jgi:peptide/nickel transport system permease protein
MKHVSLAAMSLVCLALIHLLVLLAAFFAPYDVAAQNREFPYCPPTRIHWKNKKGQLLFWHPFVYRWVERVGELEHYEEDQRVPYPIHLFPRGGKYKIGGVVSWDRHLLGVDPPARLFLMGTDGYGRDLFSRLLFGGQISLFAGLAATVLSLSFAVILGTLAGFYAGWLDALIMRSVELFLALPWLYLLLALRGFLPLRTSPGQAFLLFIIVIGLVGWGRPARLIRGVVLSVKQSKHVLAARSFGASDLYLLRCHVLPEIRGLVLTQAALLIPQYVLVEVTLSFLGLGAGEPVPSWGGMLANLQQYHVLVSKWWMFSPGFILIPLIASYGALSHSLQENRSRVRSWTA